MTTELITNTNILLCIDKIIPDILKDFCGQIITEKEKYDTIARTNFITYICGNILSDQTNCEYVRNIMLRPNRFYIIKELSTIPENLTENMEDLNLIAVGEVPINIGNMGIYFRNFFNDSNDFFNLINTEHLFQTITDSDKTSNAYRTGIYLTDVYEEANDIHFKLLRCSSNLSGPTENLKPIDRIILKKINDITPFYFSNSSVVNHILAQTYHNSIVNGSEKKAKIKEHSDKTKDMDPNGLMAFCTFYQQTDMSDIPKLKVVDTFDKKINNYSIYTKLVWRLKPDAPNQDTLLKRFDITLYPNSVFIIPLITNRYYTHEIVPSSLPINKIPTRLGYVIRSSNTNAKYDTVLKKTFIQNPNTADWTELIRADEHMIKNLKDLYFEENMTSNKINYGFTNFSLNTGDYLKPIL